MITIGLIGGVASGKSAVSELFAKRGAAILDADRVGHDVLRDPQVIQQLVGRWGAGILNPQGEIDRRTVAKIVFAADNEEERQFLNQLTHPRIGARLAVQLAALRQGNCPAAVLDAALLLEAGWAPLCDEIIFIDVPTEMRLERARARGWDEQELARREATQLPLEAKRNRATRIVDNSGSLAELAAQINRLAGEWFVKNA